LRTEGYSYSLDVLNDKDKDKVIATFDQKKIKKISAVLFFQFLVIKALDPDPEPYPDSLEILDPNSDPVPDSEILKTARKHGLLNFFLYITSLLLCIN
jgi:hypothetical protein